jgi:beta-glucosidase/6-phospho-beta-glucosidase/beta-galactosidase
MKAMSGDEDAMQALKKMAPRTPLWVTFNGPDAYAFRSYYADGGPPAKKSFALVAQVLKNTLEAHVRIYYGMKESHTKMDSDIPEPQIGLLKNIHQYDPATFTNNQRRLKPLNNFVLGFADQIQHYAVYNFFIHGVFWAQIPLDVVSKVMRIVDRVGALIKRNISIADKVAEIAVDLKYVNKKAIGALDFIGLSYYSNRYQFFSKKLDITDERLRTDGDTYYHYPHGMYRAIVEMYERFIKPLEKATGKLIPLYVAENGIATKDEDKRQRFYHEYLYAMMRATEDGYPVYGYLPWTLMDNYEWPALDTTERQYGIFAVTDDGKHLKLKPGSQPLTAFGNVLKKRGR